MKYDQSYDIINHTQKLGGGGGRKPEHRRMPDTKVHWNIISNEEFRRHHYLPPSERVGPEFESKHAHAERPATVAGEDVEVGVRDYNIISNRYLRGHRTKVGTDADAAMKLAAHRFWQTHDYNPV